MNRYQSQLQCRTIEGIHIGKKIFKNLKQISTNCISHGDNFQTYQKNKENVTDINAKEKNNFYQEYINGKKMREKQDDYFLRKKILKLSSQNLNVKDINSQQKYTFKTKRITDPQQPIYQFKYDSSKIQKNPLVNYFQKQENQQNMPKINKHMSKTQIEINLNVKDINEAPKYTFQSKRCTDPMNPIYTFDYQKSQINDNTISHYNDYQIPVFDFNNFQKKNIQIPQEKNFTRGLQNRQIKNHQPEQRNQSRETYNILTGQ